MSNTDKSKTTSATTSGAATTTSASVKPPTANEAPDATVLAGTTAQGPSVVSTSGASSDEGDHTDKIQYFVIVGKVDTFPDVSKAEEFLNSPTAPVCTVIYGKVSLVNEWHITTGKIHAFKTLVKVQKFLKEPTAPKEFVVVRGRVTVPEVRVSLRG